MMSEFFRFTEERLRESAQITFADVKPYKANSPLLPSGLLGPVTVLRDDME